MANKRSAPKSRREYGTGSVHQRSSDGRWIGTLEAGWTPEGKRRRVTVSAATEKACRDKLKVKRAELDSGVIAAVSSRTTFKMFADLWLEQAETRLRPKTYIADRSAIRQWMLPIFGHKRLSDLTPADIDAMHAAFRAAGKSTSTMNRAQSVFSKMMKAATIEGYRVHQGLVLKPKPPVAENDRTALPHVHAIAMLRVIEAEPDPSRWVATILNGLRQGERLGLTWDCVDFEKRVIYIRQQLQALQYKDNKNKHLGFRVPDGYTAHQLHGALHIVPTKTKAGTRVVPMTKWMTAALLKWREIAEPSTHGLVWPADGGGPIDPKDDRLEWRRLQDEALVRHPTGRYYTVHEGRHTTITFLKALGYEDDLVAQIVGQSQLVKDYVHVDLTSKALEALEAVTAKLELDT